MKRLSVLVLIGLIITLRSLSGASAAPQILAAIPVGEPYVLNCQGGICAAEFSAICLQPTRKAPKSGTPYQVFAKDMNAVKLTGLTLSGQKIDLPVSLLKVDSVRSQTTVRFIVNQTILEKRRLQSVSVGLERMVTLLPISNDEDAAPQSKADIRHAVAGVRRISRVWGTANADNIMIARITDRIANGLSPTAVVSASEVDQLIKLAVDDEPDISTPAAGSSRRLVAVCQRRSRFSPMRGCLEDFHDQIMLGLNGKYWTALIPGS